MKWFRGIKTFLARLAARLLTPARVVLGMVSFLIGFITMAVGTFAALFGARVEVSAYLAHAQVASLVELVGAAVQGGWIGALILVAGIVLLWVSRRVDPNGAVRSYKGAKVPQRSVKKR